MAELYCTEASATELQRCCHLALPVRWHRQAPAAIIWHSVEVDRGGASAQQLYDFVKQWHLGT